MVIGRSPVVVLYGGNRAFISRGVDGADADMLRYLMLAKSSQAAIHQATGIPKSTISEVLAGKKPFSRQMIRKLAEYFGVEVAVLAGNL
jgi:HTH-type transcriptional regulator / antitoxin HigA